MPIKPPQPPLHDMLFSLLAPLETLPSLHKNHVKLLQKIAGGKNIIDLLFTLPERYIDRRTCLTITQAQHQTTHDVITTRCELVKIRRPQRANQPTILTAQDHTGSLEILIFQKGRLFLPKIGEEILVSGKISKSQNYPTMTRPDYLIPWEKRQNFPWIEPIYPLTAGLFQAIVRRALQKAFIYLGDISEWHDPTLIKRHHWPHFKDALSLVHRPEIYLPDNTTQEDAFKNYNPYPLIEKARARLASDEILANQLCLTLARHHAQQRKGRILKGDYSLRHQLLQNFGYDPTPSQQKAITEIQEDMEKPTPMMRLLQGDVGAGKTFVAMMALLQAVEAGGQGALMAPTEILAQQHFEIVSKLCPVECVFLSGSIKGKKRKEILVKIAEGHAKIIIGTHALFQENVLFHDLALAVIDEQHRFGVEQRMKLGTKGDMTDLLIMTATPIPRTLQLTEWGEMGVSRLEGKPKGRQAIHTTLHDTAMIDDIFIALKRAIKKGQQIFWVCPLVENNETQSAIAAEERCRTLTHYFGPIVGLAHGKQDITTRQEALNLFKEGKKQILVATTVIEVGVDIPQATIMIIEEAERFGLAQLHQLRGRVGRGSARSFCLLLHRSELSNIARMRLNLLKETEDGFLIADEDFRMRGGGELAGNKQSGLSYFRLATQMPLGSILSVMSKYSKHALMRDPDFITERGEALRFLLYLFDRADPTKLLISG